MKENGSRQDELTSIAYSEKKRKLQDEQLEMPFPKQVCRDHHLDRDKFTEGIASETESINSNSFHTNPAPDSVASSDDEDVTDGKFLEMHASDETSTSSASWAGTSCDAILYSSENTLPINSSTCETESLSINELQDCLDYQNMRHVVEFGSNEHAQIDFYTDKELENQLYSKGVVSGTSYILSSGRWSVDQGAEAKKEGKKKLTIDKEFEQHFSMRML